MVEKILIIILVILVSQFRALKYGYVSDDIPVFKDPPKWKNIYHKIYLWVIGALKWSPTLDRLMTLLIHSLVCICIYLAFGSNQASFFGALLFAIHPAGQHGSVWISGRSYSLCALLLLGCLIVPSLSLLFITASCYFTTGFLTPIALIGSKYWWTVFFWPIAILIWQKKFTTAVNFKASNETALEDKKFHIGKIILCIKTIGWYFGLAVFPHKIAFYHNFLQSCAGSGKHKAYKIDLAFWTGLSLILGWGIYSIYKWDMIAYGLFFYLALIFPYSNIMRIQQEITERYLYMPMIGVMVVLGYILPFWAFLVVFGFYLGRFYGVMVQWRDDFWVVEHSCQEDPYAWYGWHLRAIKRWSVGSFHEAMTFWVMANSISPKEFKILYNLAVACKAVNKHQQAKELLEEAIKNIIPGQEEASEQLIKEFREGKVLRILT